MKKVKLQLLILVTLVFGFSPSFFQKIQAQQNPLGKSLTTVGVIDPDSNQKNIPFIGEKVVMVLYTDPDEKDVNDPLSNAIKAKKFNPNEYVGIGIANSKDTWIPDAAIRMKARQKQEQFPGSVILLDQNRAVSKAWDLGECNDMGIVIVIGKDKKVKYFKKVGTQEESKAIINEVIKAIEEALK